MKSSLKKLSIAAAAAAALGFGLTQADAADVVVASDITTSTTWTSDNTYILSNIVFVADGATLTIEEGTVIRGLDDDETVGADNNPGALVIASDSYIEAMGTATNPIVFTNEEDDNVPGGAKTSPFYNGTSVAENQISEEWGGVIVLGDTYIANDTAGGPVSNRTEQIEGVTDLEGQFGGCDDDDSSGEMHYVSIRYGGFGLKANEEINGLTMGAVGRGTELDHIEVVNNVDDGFEWFGGTVNSKYLITYNIGDDAFDSDRGYRGKSQFGLVVKGACKPGLAESGGGVANRAFEMDGGKSPDESQPYALSQWHNYTLIGLGENSDASWGGGWADDTGIEIRDNGRPQLYNFIVMDMGGDGVDIEYSSEGASSADGWTTVWSNYPAADYSSACHSNDSYFYRTQTQGYQTEIADCLFYNIGKSVSTDKGDVDLLDASKRNIVLSQSPIRNIGRKAHQSYDTAGNTIMVVTNLDPRPTSVALGTPRTAPADGFFTPVDYYGAFSPSYDWTKGGWSLVGSEIMDTPANPTAPASATSELTFSTFFQTEDGVAYVVEASTDGNSWYPVGTVLGDGSTKAVTDLSEFEEGLLYRVSVQ
ncbi:hypothetical protein [Kiritimatiella glycovorans]|uniref:Uncharacterized protein n=1 Tax=Kiritimatiella glycovorans TaxID=1307763 RepID=A0A0G3EMW7_9BACT|nr:hypothetical protein [Kiritimatiella glycovorans]AKJ65469.1 hypothetical protein L21SP4_02242 [Kiritimatiella glycovorans]